MGFVSAEALMMRGCLWAIAASLGLRERRSFSRAPRQSVWDWRIGGMRVMGSGDVRRGGAGPFTQELAPRSDAEYQRDPEHNGDYCAWCPWFAYPRLSSWQPFRDGPHPRDPETKHGIPQPKFPKCDTYQGGLSTQKM